MRNSYDRYRRLVAQNNAAGITNQNEINEAAILEEERGNYEPTVRSPVALRSPSSPVAQSGHSIERSPSAVHSPATLRSPSILDHTHTSTIHTLKVYPNHESTRNSLQSGMTKTSQPGMTRRYATCNLHQSRALTLYV